MSTALSLCVTGDCLVGKTQRVTLIPASTYSKTLDRLVSSLELVDASTTIATVQLWDPDFDEYVKIDTFDGIQGKAKFRVFAKEKNVLTPEMDAILTASDASALRLMEKSAGSEPAAALRKIQAATRACLANGDLASLHASLLSIEEAAAASIGAASYESPKKNKAAPPPSGASRRTSITSNDQGTSSPKRRKATAHNADAQQESPAAPKTPRRFVANPQTQGRPSSPQRPTVARASSPVTRLAETSDLVTLFCVYNGAMSQRAKAIRVRRERPDWNGLLATLKAKFGCDLALGYVELDSGAFVEIMDGDHLAELIQRDHSNADSMTVQCWQPDGLGDFEALPAEERAVVLASRRGAGASGGAAMDSIRRPPSSMGVGQKMDVSGALYNDEQLRDLFDAIDVDGSGQLDVDEFRKFFRVQYDGMGITDVDAKFEKLLASTTGFEDGTLDFEEFAIIMLKLSQW